MPAPVSIRRSPDDRAIRGGPAARWLAPVALSLLSPAVSARTVPTLDTEDATLGAAEVSDRSGRFHPTATIDLRNGDFTRGDYDDDAASLDRLPVHAQLGFGLELGVLGDTPSWLVARSSNGFHAPSTPERASPRSWYESNNIVALVAEPADGFRAAIAYTVKVSPNAISPATQEASLSLAYTTRQGLGVLRPTAVATRRTRGDGGVYTQAGIEPGVDLAAGDDAPRLSLPAALGVGWGGFYASGSGDRLFGQAGLAYEHPFRLGAARCSARLEALALIRDDRLRRLSGPDGETGTIVPLVTLGIAIAY